MHGSVVADLTPSLSFSYLLGTRFSVFSPLSALKPDVYGWLSQLFLSYTGVSGGGRNTDLGTIVGLWECSVFSVKSKQNILRQKKSFPGLFILEPNDFCELGARLCLRLLVVEGEGWGVVFQGSSREVPPAARGRELGLPENKGEDRCKADADSVCGDERNGYGTLPPLGMNDCGK